MLSPVKLWNHFWFEADPYRALSLFRVILGVVAALRYMHELIFFFPNYTSAPGGYYDSSLAEFLSHGAPWTVLQPLSETSLILVLMAAIFSSFCLCFGIQIRLAIVALYVSSVTLSWNGFTLVSGFKVLLPFFLFTLFFADTTRYFVWRPAFASVRRSFPPSRSELDSAFYRLLQVQVCCIYLFAAFSKATSAVWLSGSALQTIVDNRHLVAPTWQFLEKHGDLLRIGNYATMAFEFSFPFLVWLRPTRFPILVVGFVFHLLCAALVGALYLSLGMIAAYTLFYPRVQLRVLRRAGGET